MADYGGQPGGISASASLTSVPEAPAKVFPHAGSAEAAAKALPLTNTTEGASQGKKHLSQHKVTGQHNALINLFAFLVVHCA